MISDVLPFTVILFVPGWKIPNTHIQCLVTTGERVFILISGWSSSDFDRQYVGYRGKKYTSLLVNRSLSLKSLISKSCSCSSKNCRIAMHGLFKGPSVNSNKLEVSNKSLLVIPYSTFQSLFAFLKVSCLFCNVLSFCCRFQLVFEIFKTIQYLKDNYLSLVVSRVFLCLFSFCPHPHAPPPP